jgi:hypothetical protein
MNQHGMLKHTMSMSHHDARAFWVRHLAEEDAGLVDAEAARDEARARLEEAKARREQIAAALRCLGVEVPDLVLGAEG